MFFLPGRDITPEESQAQHAVSVLKEAEEIKEADGDFLNLVCEEIVRQKTILERLDDLIGGMTEEDAIEIRKKDSEDGSLRTDSRNVNDFLARLRKSMRKEEHRTEETPEARRKRIALGRKNNRVV